MDALDTFEIDSRYGFLPKDPPLRSLPSPFEAWDEAGRELPKILLSNRVRALLDDIPLLDHRKLNTRAEKERAMVLLSFIGHGYVWGEPTPPTQLPKNLAVPWAGIAQELGRPPVLSYASYALHNWRRLETNRTIEVGNIGLLQNFWGGVDEEWFILIHVAIEQAAAPAMIAAHALGEALEGGIYADLESHLKAIIESLKCSHAVLNEMTRYCDPYCYFHRVRPFIHGWKNHPVMVNGLLYEGVDRFNNQPQQFRGETGAQSSIIPALDGILKIRHEDDPLRQYLIEMKDYMPPRHRAFIDAMEGTPNIRDVLVQRKASFPSEVDAYNEAVTWVEKFRTLHLDFAASYINQQAQTSANNPSAVGTGGTPFMKYLKKHRDETSKHLL
ncbi:MAG: hypothetical protein KDD70_09520 [Bdellovibrionales bacterium]|nr:hypothetical protein [Bdellovibrionales bacterium]